jgi:hypothetical protein
MSLPILNVLIHNLPIVQAKNILHVYTYISNILFHLMFYETETLIKIKKLIYFTHSLSGF